MLKKNHSWQITSSKTSKKYANYCFLKFYLKFFLPEKNPNVTNNSKFLNCFLVWWNSPLKDRWHMIYLFKFLKKDIMFNCTRACTCEPSWYPSTLFCFQISSSFLDSQWLLHWTFVIFPANFLTFVYQFFSFMRIKNIFISYDICSLIRKCQNAKRIISSKTFSYQ